MSVKHQLIRQAKEQLQSNSLDLNKEAIFYVTTCTGNERAAVWRTDGKNFEMAWYKVERFLKKFSLLPKWIKIEIVTEQKKKTIQQAVKEIKQTKRNNYFPYGIDFGRYSVLPEEIVGNALLVPHSSHVLGRNSAQLQVNEKNLVNYLKKKYQQPTINGASITKNDWLFFSTKGIFVEGGDMYLLENDFFGQGMRKIDSTNQAEITEKAINAGATYLTSQIKNDGSFIYGYYPAYGKIISGYNSVRHFSSLYALLEVYEYSKDQELLKRIDQGLVWGIENLTLEKNGQLFVKEMTTSGLELKLGAQAMVVLALSKYESVTNDSHYHQIMLNYLTGIEYFIDNTGATSHVLDETLKVKERFRIIYYDGEALFAIMRAYPLVKDDRWLHLGEKLLERFIANGYEKYHDHWLSYSVNELTAYLPKKEYFEFGIKNAVGNLSFISERDTAYPTMLELLVAAAKMYARLDQLPLGEELIVEEDHQTLLAVMDKRMLHELRTGTMWPELAMYFAKPAKIVGGFYARHDRCRMRIDDAEHFLSGMINYKYFVEKNNEAK